MRVLVTGAAGYIGSVTTEALLNAGYEVIALDNLKSGHRAAVDPRATFVHADLCDREGTFAAFAEHKPEAVMHFAAVALVGESMERPGAYFRNNVGGTCNVFDAMSACRCQHFVFSSSCTVYGQPERMPVTENVPRHALNPYAASKIMVEEMTEWHAKLRGLRSAILRYFNPAGASERFAEDHAHETHLIPLALAVAEGRYPSVTILGTDYPTHDGTCIRDYIHVLDLAEAHIAVLEALERNPLITLNLGTGRGYSVREVIEAVQRITGQTIPTIEGPRRPNGADCAIAYADPALAREVLGWTATRGLDEMIASAWDWRQRHTDGYRASDCRDISL